MDSNFEWKYENVYFSVLVISVIVFYNSFLIFDLKYWGKEIKQSTVFLYFSNIYRFLKKFIPIWILCPRTYFSVVLLSLILL